MVRSCCSSSSISASITNAHAKHTKTYAYTRTAIRLARTKASPPNSRLSLQRHDGINTPINSVNAAGKLESVYDDALTSASQGQMNNEVFKFDEKMEDEEEDMNDEYEEEDFDAESEKFWTPRRDQLAQVQLSNCLLLFIISVTN